jgi:hypothetical protein
MTQAPAVVVAASAGSFAPGHSTPGRVAAVDETKYYIVNGMRGGQRDTLFSIAAATLGNGNRYPEIVALNRDRVQPDGGRLTDPLIVKPGWVLQLPVDATGPDVRVGPLPLVPTPATSAERASAPDDGGAAHPGATLAPMTSLPSVAVIVALLVMALLLLLRRHPFKRAAVRAAAMSLVATARPPAVVRAEDSEDSEISRPATWPDSAVHWLSTLNSMVRDPDDDPRPSTPDTAVRASGGARRLSMLEAGVRDGDDSLAIWLTGQQDGSDSAAYRWASDGEPISRVPGTVPAVVGLGPRGTLVIDLARAPDVITVTGRNDGPRRQARRLAEQLIAVGVPVLATAGAFDEPAPSGIRVLTGLDDPALAHAPADAGPRVLFCPGDAARGREAESRSLRGLVRDRDVVVILVGSARRSRWCIDVRRETTSP